MYWNKVYIRDGRAPIPKSATTSKVMSLIKSKNTKPEMILRKALWQIGLRGYRLHWKNIPGTPDIVFVSKKIAIFVNGCYWHRCPNCKPNFPKSNENFWKEKFQKNTERDQKKTEELKKLNWMVLTLWECEIKNHLDDCIEKIMNSLTNEIVPIENE